MKRHFVYRNSLSIVFLTLFALALLAQAYFGWKEQQEVYQEHGKYLALSSYLRSGHFVAATFENFQSEFLQMVLYVVLTIFLRQIGSAESKRFDEIEEVDREPAKHPDAPSPVMKEGWRLALYKHSLSLAFLILFICSWIGHLYGSYHSLLEENRLEGKAPLPMGAFLLKPQFWFETFQNWQSEFLSVASIVILSIYLRQKGSPQSKPVDSPHMKTGK